MNLLYRTSRSRSVYVPGSTRIAGRRCFMYEHRWSRVSRCRSTFRHGSALFKSMEINPDCRLSALLARFPYVRSPKFVLPFDRLMGTR